MGGFRGESGESGNLLTTDPHLIEKLFTPRHTSFFVYVALTNIPEGELRFKVLYNIGTKDVYGVAGHPN